MPKKKRRTCREIALLPRTLTLGLLLAASAWAAPGRADAAQWTIESEGPATRPMHLDATVSLWVKGVGAGVWYAFPVRGQGLIPGINDSLDVELGGFMLTHRNRGDGNDFALVPLGGLRWQFHLTPDWSAFWALRAGAHFGLDAGGISPRVGGALGAYWRLTNALSLRLEVGYPGALQVGLGVAR